MVPDISLKLLDSLFTAGTLTGFDASGHIAEETKNARYTLKIFYSYNGLILAVRVVAARGILTSAIATGVLGFVTAILFLFCTPDLDTLFALDAPQPFVQIYAMALGKGGSVVMTIIATIGLIMVSHRVFTCPSTKTESSAEYQHSHRRCFTACLCGCSRRRASLL